MSGTFELRQLLQSGESLYNIRESIGMQAMERGKIRKNMISLVVSRDKACSVALNLCSSRGSEDNRVERVSVIRERTKAEPLFEASVHAL